MGEGQFWEAAREFDMVGVARSMKWIGWGCRGQTIWGLALEGRHNQNGSGLRLPDLEYRCHQPAVWPWDSYLPPLSFCIVHVK